MESHKALKGQLSMPEKDGRSIRALVVFFALWINGSFYPLILLPLIFTAYYCRESLSKIGIGTGRIRGSLVLGLLAGLLVLGAYYPVFLLYRGTRAGTIPNLWSILIDVLWYPLYEEVSYRGFFLGFFARENTDFTSHNLGLNLAQALLFVSVHHHHVSAGVPLLLIPVFLLGFFNGLVFLRSRNIVGCIVGHAVVNWIAWLMSILTL
jgi:membrane protease YdiL (CAAX protease family)